MNSIDRITTTALAFKSLVSLTKGSNEVDWEYLKNQMMDDFQLKENEWDMMRKLHEQTFKENINHGIQSKGVSNSTKLGLL